MPHRPSRRLRPVAFVPAAFVPAAFVPAAFVPAALVLAALVATLTGLPTLDAHAQAGCANRPDGAGGVCDLASPDAQGVTVRGAFDRVGQARVYRFQVADEARTVQIYVGDLWYQVAVSLWRGAPDAEVPVDGMTACSSARGCLAESHRSERRVLQFLQPRSIVERLEPGTYALVVAASEDPGFDPNRGFTVRVALAPAACAIEGDARREFQLGLIVQPAAPRRADLMTFSAFVSPPYTDLFDFEWTLDGEPVSGSSPELMQRAVTQLPATPDGQHVVRVTARGARAYPDPDQPAVPTSLSAECTFSIR